MKHKYAHIRDLRQLEDEMLKLKLRKQIIRNEFSLSYNAAKDHMLSGGYLLSLVYNVIGSSKQRKDRDHDTLDSISTYAGWISNLLELINRLRK